MEIVTAGGSTVHVTPDHVTIVVDDSGVVRPKRANAVRIGDRLAVLAGNATVTRIPPSVGATSKLQLLTEAGLVFTYGTHDPVDVAPAVLVSTFCSESLRSFPQNATLSQLLT